jgi:hypothetical protein
MLIQWHVYHLFQLIPISVLSSHLSLCLQYYPLIYPCVFKAVSSLHISPLKISSNTLFTHACYIEIAIGHYTLLHGENKLIYLAVILMVKIQYITILPMLFEPRNLHSHILLLANNSNGNETAIVEKIFSFKSKKIKQIKCHHSLTTYDCRRKLHTSTSIWSVKKYSWL